MNTKLYPAVPFVLDSGRSRVSIPEGFPIVVDHSMEIVKPILLYLFTSFVKLRVKGVPNTWKAYAQDLSVWWDFLGYRKIRWWEATSEDFEVFLDGLKNATNPVSGLPYAETTIVRRCNSVVRFYNHAWRQNWIRAVPPQLSPAKGSLNYLGQILKSNDDDDEIRKALLPHEYRAIADCLGPTIPFAGKAAGSCRDRLWAELMVLTGMRPAQPASIKVQEILNLDPVDFENLAGVTFLSITAKGNKQCRARIPNSLLKKLLWYIENERKEAVTKGAQLGHFKAGSIKALFVNGLDAKHNVGFPAKYPTFYAAFSRAARKVHARGLLKNHLRVVEAVDPVSGEIIEKNVLEAHPHILRHTFTIWNIAAEKRNGSQEPYKNTSTLLGHKNLETTVKIYSKSVGEFEAMLSDRIAHSLTRLIYGSGT